MHMHTHTRQKALILEAVGHYGKMAARWHQRIRKEQKVQQTATCVTARSNQLALLQASRLPSQLITFGNEIQNKVSITVKWNRIYVYALGCYRLFL
jgi:ribulose 1,5-bisphosphate synthetase/thiazole synthase